MRSRRPLKLKASPSLRRGQATPRPRAGSPFVGGGRPLGRPAGRLLAQVVPPVALQVESPDQIMSRARGRTGVVLACCALAFLALLGRAADIMLLPDARLSRQAQLQFQDARDVESPRGDILDRNGTLLATTVSMPELRADPSRLKPEDLEPLARALGPILGQDPEVLHRLLDQPKKRNVLLAGPIDPAVLPALRDVAPGGALFTEASQVRYYPSRRLATQVLGIVGANGRGQEGLERELDRRLRGMRYRYVLARDRTGRALSPTPAHHRATPGQTVVLTLDSRIQLLVEQALDRIMERSVPQSASIIVLDVATGEVLGLGNRPTTNPNDRANLDTAALRLHAVADEHEPGSVIKPFAVALALEAGLAEPDTLVDAEGGRWLVGRTPIRDDHPHGVITVGEVLKYSSNIATAKLALQLGPHRLIQGFRDFGFSTPTGAQLPGENPGRLRNPDSIRPIELATTAYGQGMQATPIQLAVALAALGNGGVRMQPYLVREVRDPSGQVVSRSAPRQVTRVVSERTARDTVAMLTLALEEGGTATRARLDGYTAAGKTGTAEKVVDRQYSDHARVASFIGLAPATQPRLAIAVVVDTPTVGSRYGGIVSAPAFAEIAGPALEWLGVPFDAPRKPPPKPAAPAEGTPAAVPDAPSGPPPSLLWLPDGRLNLPDLQGMSLRDALATLDGAGLAVRLMGSGAVARQQPAPGAHLAPGDAVVLTFQ